eukprot:531791-Rhodomonas_salina.1
MGLEVVCGDLVLSSSGASARASRCLRYRATRRYGVSGTDIAYRTCLRACYGVSGTELAYAASRASVLGALQTQEGG